MLVRSTLLALAACFCLQSSAQTLISIDSVGAVPAFSANFVLAAFGLSAKNDIAYYTVTYTMDNLEGRQDTVSGLFITPTNVDESNRYPRLVYQHGTTADKFGVPSRATPGQDLSYLFATQGYVVFAPDFLNMGDDQEGFHPYVHARTEALAAINMMEALAQSPEYLAIANEEQLFLTGYSQGGHASMALHEILIEEYPNTAVTATAHMSGPYSISDVMLNEVILADETFFYPGFLPYTVLAYQAVYDDLDEDLDEIFRAPYAPLVEAFRDGYETGGVRLDTLNAQLLRTYLAVEGDATFYPSRLMTPAFVDSLRTPGNKYLAALQDNDTYDFVNPTPTRLFYCTADDQVKFRNSILARDSMQANGAADTEAVDVQSDATHGECVVPATAAAAAFFEQYQIVLSSTDIPHASTFRWVQVSDELRVYTGTNDSYRLELYDQLGRQLVRQAGYREGDALSLTGLRTGYTVARLVDEAGRAAVHPLIVR